MEQCEENSQENDDVIIEKEISKLIEEQRLFTESIYACLPVGIEIYDAHGVLRSINDHALRMYGCGMTGRSDGEYSQIFTKVHLLIQNF